MNIQLSRALCASTALATGLLLAGQALAQSTGTAAVEELVVTGSRGPKNLEGAIVAVEVPKSRATITQEFISKQAPGATILETINLMPGVNFTNNDAYGSAGGDITIRGFDSQRIALLQDGVALNDSGNYAIYPNQQLDSDLISKVDVNLGTTDVDSPTAAASGGTINYVTRVPQDEMGVRAEAGFGEDSFERYYGTFETGKVGPFGTKAWFSGLYTRNDIVTPQFSTRDAPGKIKKMQFNARIYQELGDRGDFVSLIAHYNENRNNFVRRINLGQFQRNGVTTANAPDLTLVYDATCARPTPGAGVQNEATTATGFTAACANYVGNNINPSNTGNIRGQGSFHLTDNIILTVDPSFQYTLANGGGRTIFSEADQQLRTPTDLNGDGDTVDRVLMYWPNTTNTRRYSLTSSLIWKFADNQSLRAAYTLDYARHRQTGDASRFDQNGDPESVFGAKDGHADPILLSDGTNLRRRDRFSIATLNQFSVEYRGRWFEDKLLVNVGVRAPFFKRELNNYCYQRDTFNAYCTTQPGFAVSGTNDGSGRPLVVFPIAAAANSSQAAAGTGSQTLTAAQRTAFLAFYNLPANSTVASSAFFSQPRSWTRKYDKVLPNVGVSYNFTDNISAYGSYAKTLSAPRTDDLYDIFQVDPDPETADAFDFGVRYQSPVIIASVSAFHYSFKNRIERQFDEAANLFFSVNVGDVTLKGFDGQLGFKPVETLSVYGTLSYVDSEIKDDFPNGVTNGVTQFLPTAGKQLFEKPKWQGGVRVDWDPMEALSLGVQGKFVGDRWTNLVNTEKAPGYTTWDVYARYKLTAFNMENTYLQVNVKNLFNENYLGDITPNVTGTGTFQPGYGRTAIATLHVEF